MSDEKTAEQLAADKALSEQKVAEANLAVARAKKELNELNYPESPTTGVEGTITLGDKAGYYSEVMSYTALVDATDMIAREISRDVMSKPLVISTNFDIADQTALWNVLMARATSLKTQLDALSSEFIKGGIPRLSATRESVLAGLAAAPVVLGAITDIAKFFKTDRTINARSFKLSEVSLLAASANSIKKHVEGLHVVLAKIDVEATGQLESKLLELLNYRVEMARLRQGVYDSIEPELAKLDSWRNAIADIKRRIEKEQDVIAKASLAAQLSEQEDQLEIASWIEKAWQKAADRFDKAMAATLEFIDGLTERPQGGKSLLEQVHLVDIWKSYKDPNFLLMELSSSGGESETSKGPLSSSEISYIGAAVVTYVLIDSTGICLSSGVVHKANGKRYKQLID